MPLLGRAAMLLSFDVAPEAVAEHDDWHTREHLPERLSIPGFMRGSRWVAVRGGPRYFVLYEVEDLATLSSDAYLQRLNNPSPWTSRMMAHYRGMTRGFCSVAASFGVGIGGVCLLVRFKPPAGTESSFRQWLCDEALLALPARRGLGSVHLLEGALTPAMTNEQRIRGADAGVDWALVVSGYSQEVLAQLPEGDFLEELARRGAADVVSSAYRLDYSLSASEIKQ
jgi:hypothetical protein